MNIYHSISPPSARAILRATRSSYAHRPKLAQLKPSRKISDQRHSKRKRKSISEALDAGDFLSPPPQQNPSKGHHQAGDHRTNQDPHAAYPRRMSQRMRKKINTCLARYGAQHRVAHHRKFRPWMGSRKDPG